MTLEVFEETVGLIKARVMVNNIKEWLEMAIITAIQAPVKRIMEAGSKHTHTHKTLGKILNSSEAGSSYFWGNQVPRFSQQCVQHVAAHQHLQDAIFSFDRKSSQSSKMSKNLHRSIKSHKLQQI